VFLCDTFRGIVKAGEKDPLYRGGELANTSEELVRSLVDRLGLKNVRILTGVFPDDTAHLVDDRTFKLCHIDVDVYESARDILKWIWPRLVVGGILIYDDYGFATCAGIATHVDEQRQLPDRLVIHNLNGHAIVIKTA
jgi:O-methyltransferase